MDFFTQKQHDILLKAYQELDKSSPVFPSPEEAEINTSIMLSMPSFYADLKKRHGDPGERDNLSARIIAYRYYTTAESICVEKGSDYSLYRSFFMQISNTIIAIIRLAEQGFDYQAISLIRNTVELFMMLIVISDSPKVREKVKNTKNANSADTLWKQYFRKSKFIEMISPYSESFRYIVDSVEEWIKQIYKELSSFVHNDYAQVLTYSLSREDSGGYSHLNFWGKYVTREAEIYNRLITSIAPLDLILCSILKDPTKDITLFHLYNADKDYESMMNYFNANTLHKISMILYADISKRTVVKEHIPVPFCNLQRSPLDPTIPLYPED